MVDLSSLGADFDKESPASISEIDMCEIQLGRRLPPAYREFLLEANGGEGPIGKAGYLALWPIHMLQEKLKAYQFERDVSQFLPIGSDGGNEALVIDYRAEPNWLGYVPFGDLQYESFVPISTNFWDALRIIGEGRAFD